MQKSRRGSRPAKLLGKRAGRLLVLEDIGRRRGNVVWKCLCDCGNITEALSVDILRGHTKSCGCLQKERCGEAASLKNRIEYGEASFNKVFRGYERSAKRRNLFFGLSKKEFKYITQQDCYYCGKVPSQISRNGYTYNGEYIYNGIDRIDNSVGYIKDNCVPCCWECNSAKGSLSFTEFVDLVQRIYKRRVEKHVFIGGE